jgi:TPR repeat protein
MYQHGLGVPQDDDLAATFFRHAAQQGDVAAKFKLGLMYAQGRGVQQDDVKAYKWFALTIAASKPGSQAYIVTSRDMRILKASMSSAQIAQGQQEAAVWRTVHPNGG